MSEPELSIEQRCKLAAGFIAQSPPGEVNDVINDIRSIISDDNALMPHIIPALRAYNQTQLLVVEHQSTEQSPAHTSLLSAACMLPSTGEGEEGERYIDAEGKRSFEFDHVTLAITDYQPYNLPEEEETFRADLAKSLSAYTKNHFPAGHSTVSCSQYPLLPPLPPTPAPAPPAPATDTVPNTEAPSTETAAEPEETLEVPKAEEPATDVVTDVIPEQVNSGSDEPAPTPAFGEVSHKTDEISGEKALDVLDEKVEEVKAEEEGQDVSVESQKQAVEEVVPAPETSSEEVEEVKEENEAQDEKPQEVVVERKQERLDDPVYTLEIVGNRYNPSNFWTGRWRTQWIVNQKAGTVEGTIKVDVHYYEQGNVQLAASHTASFPYPTSPQSNQSIPSQIVTTISKIETNYHLELNDVYGELGDKAFRALRRALPITRQKMEWEKISGYGLGSELTQARG